MDFTSMKQLRDFINNGSKIALEETQTLIHEAIQEAIQEFYDEYEPYHYQRTYSFLNSLISTNVIQKGNSFVCEVKIDENYLNSTYPSDDFDNGISTGFDVVQRANDQSDPVWHGQLVHIDKDRGFWDDAMLTLSGEYGILQIFKSKLKKHGITV